MATRDYTAPGITVHWDSELCIHSERCTNGAPQVFDRSTRPWVDPAGAPADEVARVVDTCPSAALTYTRTDGAAPGRRGRVPGAASPPELDAGTPVVITPLRDGPLVLTGRVVLDHGDGTVQEVDRVLLCRCGHSGTKPRCDGTHQHVEFSAPGVEEDDLP